MHIGGIQRVKSIFKMLSNRILLSEKVLLVESSFDKTCNGIWGEGPDKVETTKLAIRYLELMTTRFLGESL